MTTFADLKDAMATLGPAAEHAAAGFRALSPDAFAELPPSTAPHGPGAARQVAQQLADAGHHSHLVAGGQTTCLSGCGRTPGEVLL